MSEDEESRIERNGNEIIVYQDGTPLVRGRTNTTKFHMKRRSLLALLLIPSLIGVAFASAFLYYDWSMTLTAATPQVRFMKWSDQTLTNTIALSSNVYADAWVKNDNDTYGIKNTGATPKTCSVWFSSIVGGSYVANITIVVTNQTGTTLATLTTNGATNIGEGYAQSFTSDANGIKTDTLKIWVKGAGSVGSVTVNLGMKTNE